MGQPTGTALTLDDQLRGQTLSSVLARLAGPEAATPYAGRGTVTRAP